MGKVANDVQYLDELTAHVEKWIGPVETVLHEIVSDKVHVDILLVQPEGNRSCYTLITSGMSALPQATPDEMRMFERTELIITLRADNPYLSNSGTSSAPGDDDPQGYYPIRDLKSYALFPHSEGTWLGPGHTLVTHDPPRPLGNDTNMTGYLVHFPFVIKSHEGWSFGTKDGNRVSLLQIYPIHTDELEYKFENGGDALVDKLAESDALECFDPFRPSVVPHN
jgi:Suppressor of fused protein (SUFU)